MPVNLEYRMMRSTKALLLIFAIGALAGCGGQGPVFPFDARPGALDKISTVAVISPTATAALWRTPPAMHTSGPAVVWTGVAAGNQGIDADERFFKLVQRYSGAPVSTLLARDVVSQLARMGYEARLEDGPWVAREDYSTKDFDKIKSSADAVLVIQLTYVDFSGAGPSNHYRIGPEIGANITLLGRDRNGELKQLLYRGFHNCDARAKRADDWRHSTTQWGFDDFDQMISQPRKPAKALADAASQVAATVAQGLRR